MPLTPLDIHNKEFRKTFRGYSEEEVDDFLDEVVRDFEQLIRENAELREELAKVNAELGRIKQLEDSLKGALVIAEQTAEEVRNNARKEAEVIVREAKLSAERVAQMAAEKVRQAENEFVEVQREIHSFRLKLRGLLLAELETIDQSLDQYLAGSTSEGGSARRNAVSPAEDPGPEDPDAEKAL